MALRSSVLLLAAAAASAAAAAATSVAASTTALAATPSSAAATTEDMQDGCVHFQIIHSTNAAHFSKRAVELSLANRSDVAYYAKLNFGTPSQAQYVQLDTGSFELWVNPTCTGLSTGDASFCNAVGSFDPSDSSTFSSLGVGKQLRYGIGSANITYVKDDISLPGTTTVLEQVQFGVATSTTDEFSGILGIGYGEGLTTVYPNFIDQLALQNVTRVKAFTLALGSKSEQEGVIVFGGVDTSKFSGQLERLPITPAKFSPDGVPRYWVNMSSMALTTPAGVTKAAYAGSALQVFLDSGSTLSLLPTALADSIAADFGVTTGADSDGFYYVDCSLASASTSNNGSLDFTFGGTTVRVPYRELIRQSGGQCMLGLQASTDFVLLGDTFLRSAYVVIDQTDNVVWMAPYVNCGSTPAALASSASLATLTGLCAATNNLAASTGGSSTSSSSSTSTSTSSKSATAATSPSTSTASSQSTSSSSSSSSSTTGAKSSSASRSAGLSGSLFAAAAGSLVAAVVRGSAVFGPWL